MKLINNNRTIFFSSLFLLMAFYSCRKDMGTYEVNPINRISIGLDSFYFVNKGAHLIIKPNIQYSKDQSSDTSNYNFEWFIFPTPGVNSITNSVSRSRDLDFSDRVLTGLILSTGVYKVYYRITDKKTGVFSSKYLNIQISTPIYEGWLALCEPQEGTSRLDMVTAGKDTVYRDILQIMGSNFSLSNKGKPRFVNYVGGYYLNLTPEGNLDQKFGICVGTSTNAWLLDQDSIKLYPANFFTGPNDLNGRFALKSFTPPSTWADAVMPEWRDGSGLAPLYVNHQLYMTGSGNPIATISNMNGVPFNPSPWTVVGKDAANNVNNAIIFNQDTKTFLMYAADGRTTSTTTALPPPGAGKLFDFNTGMDLQYMDFTPYQKGVVYAVLKKSSTQRYLATFTTGGKQMSYQELIADGLSDDSQFAVSPVQGYLLYTVGNKIYEYDPILNQSFLMHDYGDRKISVFKFQKFRSSATNINAYNVLANKLIVATYEAGDWSSSGKIDLYTVPDINGTLQLYKSYTGLGKVVSLSYMIK